MTWFGSYQQRRDIRPSIWPFVLAIACAVVLTATVPAHADLIKDIRHAINTVRTENGLPQLTSDPKLDRTARIVALTQGHPKGAPDLCHLAPDAGYACGGLAQLSAAGGPGSAAFIAALIDNPQTFSILTERRFAFFGVNVAAQDSAPNTLGVPQRRLVILLGDPPRPAARTWRSAALSEVNRFRAANNLQPLKLAPLLNEAAQRHADDMAYKDYFGHVDPDGNGPGNRAQAAGFQFERILENLAAGQSDARSAVEGWIKSPRHRAAMLDDQITEAGIGYRFLSSDTGTSNHIHYWSMTMAVPVP